MYAAGFRSGDLAHNSFSYHMTPGAFIMESGLHAVGCTVFPAGIGQIRPGMVIEIPPLGIDPGVAGKGPGGGWRSYGSCSSKRAKRICAFSDADAPFACATALS